MISRWFPVGERDLQRETRRQRAFFLIYRWLKFTLHDKNLRLFGAGHNGDTLKTFGRVFYFFQHSARQECFMQIIIGVCGRLRDRLNHFRELIEINLRPAGSRLWEWSLSTRHGQGQEGDEKMETWRWLMMRVASICLLFLFIFLCSFFVCHTFSRDGTERQHSWKDPASKACLHWSEEKRWNIPSQTDNNDARSNFLN